MRLRSCDTSTAAGGKPRFVAPTSPTRPSLAQLVDPAGAVECGQRRRLLRLGRCAIVDVRLRSVLPPTTSVPRLLVAALAPKMAAREWPHNQPRAAWKDVLRVDAGRRTYP